MLHVQRCAIPSKWRQATICTTFCPSAFNVALSPSRQRGNAQWDDVTVRGSPTHGCVGFEFLFLSLVFSCANHSKRLVAATPGKMDPTPSEQALRGAPPPPQMSEPLPKAVSKLKGLLFPALWDLFQKTIACTNVSSFPPVPTHV
jgi:hypothetical protein